MTKKHFIALANALRGLEVSEDVIKALVGFCYNQNPNFNEHRWREYLAGNCGPSGGKR